MGTLVEQLQARKGYLKLTWEDLADRVHKDVSTVKKQLSLTSSPSIATLEEYALAMDSEIVLLSDDALADYKSSGVPRAQKSMAALDREREDLTEKVKEKDEQIRFCRDRIRFLEEALIKKDDRINMLTDKLMEKL